MAAPAAGEDPGADIFYRMRSRIDQWFRGVDAEVRKVLVDILKSEGGSRAKVPGKADMAVRAAEIDPDLELYDEPEMLEAAGI